jgi:raffinose/stachyose/melibiose transport system substrate-binding protein
MKSIRAALAILCALVLAGCQAAATPSTTAGQTAAQTGAQTQAPQTTEPAVQGRAINWYFAREKTGAVAQAIQTVADEYKKTHPAFSLNLVTYPDRPSYLQKIETLAAANQLPDIWDTDATPFAQKLRSQGAMVDLTPFLKSIGVYDSFVPMALDYERFDDGALYLLPLEFHMEFFWYNKALFTQAGIQVPQTLDELPTLCQTLRSHNIIPIAVDGQDGWPLLRYMAFIPFRLTANDYVKQLKQAKTTLSVNPGLAAAQWVAELGKNKCFQGGFTAATYSDARDLFTSGKAAIYYMGTWELPTFAGDTVPASVKSNLDFFTMPMEPGATTTANDMMVAGGIGAAFNAKTFDANVQDFVTYLLANYPAQYAALGQFVPMKRKLPQITNPTALYTKAEALISQLGTKTMMPWDTQFDPTSNSRIEQELPLLVLGNETPEQFIQTMNTVIQTNAPKYFGP